MWQTNTSLSWWWRRRRGLPLRRRRLFRRPWLLTADDRYLLSGWRHASHWLSRRIFPRAVCVTRLAVAQWSCARLRTLGAARCWPRAADGCPRLRNIACLRLGSQSLVCCGELQELGSRRWLSRCRRRLQMTLLLDFSRRHVCTLLRLWMVLLGYARRRSRLSAMCWLLCTFLCPRIICLSRFRRRSRALASFISIQGSAWWWPEFATCFLPRQIRIWLPNGSRRRWRSSLNLLARRQPSISVRASYPCSSGHALLLDGIRNALLLSLRQLRMSKDELAHHE